jgi:hypothetical protein
MKPTTSGLLFMMALGYAILVVPATAIAEGLPAAPPAMQKSSQPSSGTPKIEVKETTFDFGKQFSATDLKHVFTFKNVGSGILKIEKVSPG